MDPATLARCILQPMMLFHSEVPPAPTAQKGALDATMTPSKEFINQVNITKPQDLKQTLRIFFSRYGFV